MMKHMSQASHFHMKIFQLKGKLLCMLLFLKITKIIVFKSIFWDILALNQVSEDECRKWGESMGDMHAAKGH